MKNKIGLFLILLLLGGGIVAYNYYNAIMSPNTGFSSDDKLIQIHSNTDYQGLCNLLDENNIVANLAHFQKTAKIMKYDEAKIKSGQYKIKSGWSSRKIIQSLRSGKQTPIKLSFNNARNIPTLVGKISPFIELDSITLLNYLNDKNTLETLNTNKQNLIAQFTPNTYEVYWNISAKDLVTRLKSETEKFWKKNNRREKAQKMGYSREQVYTLASIVEKETQANVEKPRIAGVYLNRLKRNIPLQADPTVVFALQKFDLRRVLHKHLEYDSPYNTYKYAGLPPGPIFMPSISSIDAVLNPEKHKYLYFCARPDGSGQHAFARNLSEHNNNAKKYQRWLNKNRIK